MTDSQQDGGGLPTAAIEEKCVECGMVDLVYSTDYEGRGSNCSNPESKDQELVRRKDVKALIQDKIKRAEEKIEKYNGLDRLNLNDAKARKQELESLLEELEQ